MSVSDYKIQAERLAKHLATKHGITLKHSSILEALAATHGCKDWNTLSGLAPGLVATEVVDNEKSALPPEQQLALDVFIRNLNQIGFQDGLPNGLKAIGWKVGNRIYVLEIKLRETLLAKLPSEVQDALALTAAAKRGFHHPFTINLMKAFDSKGWLVKESKGTEVVTREALWDIRAGKLPYRGVLILDIPVEYENLLPIKDSIYEIDVTGPLFTQDVVRNSLGLFSRTPIKAPVRKTKPRQ